jgi:hypothetical protein
MLIEFVGEQLACGRYLCLARSMHDSHIAINCWIGIREKVYELSFGGSSANGQYAKR